MTRLLQFALAALLPLAPAVAPPVGAMTQPSSPECLTLRLLQHPLVTDVGVEPPREPAFSQTIEGRNLVVRFTDSDAEPTHNATADQIQPLLRDLEAVYKKFVRTFGKIDPAAPAKIEIHVFNFRLTPGYENVLAFTRPDTAVINVLPAVVASPCLGRSTLSHELFHRVQVAHLGAAGLIDEYWIEGSAEWATVFADRRNNEFLDYVLPVFQSPGTWLVERSYDAVLFWLYVEERFRELRGTRSGAKFFDLVLDRSEEQGQPTVNLPAVLSEFFKPKGQQARDPALADAPAHALFLQEWHLANVYTALGIPSKKLGYGPYDSRPDRCGTQRQFPPLRTLAVPIDSDQGPFADTAEVFWGAAKHYAFSPGPNVTSLNIKVRTESPSQVMVSHVATDGGKVVSSQTTGNRDLHEHALTFQPNGVELILLTVGGVPNLAPVNRYVLSVNEPAGGPQKVRIKVVATLSTSPDDTFGDPIVLNVSVGGETVQTNPGDPPIVRVLADGVVSVLVDESLLTSEGRDYRVGFVSVAASASGAVVKCAPNGRGGNVSFLSESAAINPDSDSDYTVGIRIVPLDADPLTGGAAC